MRKRVLRDERLWLIGVVWWPLRNVPLRWRRRHKIFSIAVIRIAIKVTLEVIRLTESVAPVHSIWLLVNAAHSRILSLRGQNDTVIMFGVLQIILGRH
jgi:hypothetical protein